MTFAPAEVESAIARVNSLEDAAARAAAQAAVRAVLDLHGEGLRRMSECLRALTADGDRMLRTVVEDELVASLFMLHGIHPQPVETRVRRALDATRAAASDGVGSLEIVSLDAASVRLRVAGGKELRRAVTRAVADAAPELEHIELSGANSSLVPLARLTRKSERSARAADEALERCELCGEGLTAAHEHLLDIERRKLRCACLACALLFDAPASKLRRVRPRVTALEGFRLNEARWVALQVPVGLAFFFHSSSLNEVVAAYPGPAGATESVVPKLAWDALVADNPVLTTLESDTSALLVERLRAQPTYHLLSIDACYRLTGMVRSCWQGLTGGDAPLRAVEEFFSSLPGGVS